MMCTHCGAPLPEGARSCPQCHTLVHAGQLEALSGQARSATAAGDLVAARAAWSQALVLLPPDSVQYSSVERKVADLAVRLAAPPPSGHHPLRKRLGGLGVFGPAAWKFQTL